jgi:PilX N-terminal
MVANLIRNEDGMVLVVVLMILMATVMLGMGSLMVASTDIKISGNYKESASAFYAAEAGVERALTDLRNDLDWTAGYAYTSLPNAAQYKVDFSVMAGKEKRILSTGKLGRACRQVELVVNVDSVFIHALNAGGDMILTGKPRISAEGIRANGTVMLDLDNGTPLLNVYTPDPSSAVLLGDVENVVLTQDDPMDFDAVKLTQDDWQAMADAAPEDFYFDSDGTFNSKDTDVTLDGFDCDDIPADEDGKRTLFVDGDIFLTDTITGICTIVATGKIVAQGGEADNGEGRYTGFATKSEGVTISMIAMDDILLNFDSNAQSFMNGLVYTEGDYELHGKIKFTGVVTSHGNVSIQNPSEFTNNNSANYWYTYSSAYNVIADPIQVLSWHEKVYVDGC